MNTSISPACWRSSSMVDAGRAWTSGFGIRVVSGALDRPQLDIEVGALVGAGEPRQQVIDLASRGGAQRRSRLALRVARDRTAAFQHVLAHSEADPLLLLVAKERQVRVKQIVSGFALAGFSQL